MLRLQFVRRIMQNGLTCRLKAPARHQEGTILKFLAPKCQEFGNLRNWFYLLLCSLTPQQAAGTGGASRQGAQPRLFPAGKPRVAVQGFNARAIVFNLY